MTRKTSSSLFLTDRAVLDIQDIFEYSKAEWGKRSAEKYLDQLEAGLERLKEHPELLKSEPELHPSLKFYRIRNHLVACDTTSKSIVVLTVIHASMDIPTRLAELELRLSAEVELLHQRFASKRAKKS